MAGDGGEGRGGWNAGADGAAAAADAKRMLEIHFERSVSEEHANVMTASAPCRS